MEKFFIQKNLVLLLTLTSLFPLTSFAGKKMEAVRCTVEEGVVIQVLMSEGDAWELVQGTQKEISGLVLTTLGNVITGSEDSKVTYNGESKKITIVPTEEKRSGFISIVMENPQNTVVYEKGTRKAIVGFNPKTDKGPVTVTENSEKVSELQCRYNDLFLSN